MHECTYRYDNKSYKSVYSFKNSCSLVFDKDGVVGFWTYLCEIPTITALIKHKTSALHHLSAYDWGRVVGGSTQVNVPTIVRAMKFFSKVTSRLRRPLKVECYSKAYSLLWKITHIPRGLICVLEVETNRNLTKSEIDADIAIATGTLFDRLNQPAYHAWKTAECIYLNHVIAEKHCICLRNILVGVSNQ